MLESLLNVGHMQKKIVEWIVASGRAREPFNEDFGEDQEDEIQ